MPKHMLIAFAALGAGLCSAQIPEITSINPNSAKPGDLVIVRGENFDFEAGANTVFFGPVRGEVLESSPRELQVRVPLGVAYAPVRVTVDHRSAESAVPFAPLPDAPFVARTNTFAERRIAMTATGFPALMTLADFDRDGLSDLAVKSVTDIWIYENEHSSGLFSERSFGPAVGLHISSGAISFVAADFDSDGKTDIVVHGNPFNFGSGIALHAFKNQHQSGPITRSSFSQAAVWNYSGYRLMAAGVMDAGDVDGDGRPDVAAPSTAGVFVFQNLSVAGSTNLSFAAPVVLAPLTNYDRVQITDLDNDHRPEILASSSNSPTLYIHSHQDRTGNIQSNSFAAPLGLVHHARIFDFKIADLNRDGAKEIVVLGSDPQRLALLSIYAPVEVQESTLFFTRFDLDIPRDVYSLNLGDIDADARLDIILFNRQNRMTVLRNESTPGALFASSFTPAFTIPIYSTEASLAVADLDHDTLPDLAFAFGGRRTIFVMQNVTRQDLAVAAGARFSPDLLQFTITGPPTERVMMERSTDLVTWEPAFATNVTRAADLNLRVRAEAVREFFRVKR